jgi:AraC family transcriptional regulator of adaptative response/methylated-DNA-[protein]-cysteine methyltransferase
MTMKIADTTLQPFRPSAAEDPRWAAVVTRDRAADGTFYYSVATTGVYCRPSCASRLANPKNVHFHGTADDAERAGYRPCKRCRPRELSVEQLHARAVARVCERVKASESAPNLATMARWAKLSPYHFHRVFKALTGLTPRAYVDGIRGQRVRHALAEGRHTVTAAIYEAGFNSSGRFYERADGLLGMTPSRYRNGGAQAEIRFAVGQCSLGSVLVAQSQKGICAISLGDDPETLVGELRSHFPRATLIDGGEEFEATVARVVRLVESPRIAADLPLDIQGTAFQQRVWQALRAIPVGTTASYAEIAERVGMPTGARAVARACAANPIAVAIPCHRVVRTDGALSGYRWGLERKRTLLRREGTT